MPTPRKPTVLKQLEGTARRDRSNPDEPKPPAVEVGTVPPAWLHGERRRRAWRELAELLRAQGLLTVLDAPALALLVDAYGDYLEAAEVVAGTRCGLCGRSLRSKRACSSGEEHYPGDPFYTTRTKEGSLMIRPHPAVARREDAWKRVVTLLREFGMTPAARTRVAAAGAETHDPVEAFLDARRSA